MLWNVSANAPREQAASLSSVVQTPTNAVGCPKREGIAMSHSKFRQRGLVGAALGIAASLVLVGCTSLLFVR